ncbi:hypothetical protein ACHAO7_011560 [Fusarium culmorum]
MRGAGANYVFDYNDEDVILKLRSALPNVQHAFDTIGNETSSATIAKAMASTGALIRSMGELSSSTIEETMNLNREGLISGEKLVFKGFP